MSKHHLGTLSDKTISLIRSWLASSKRLVTMTLQLQPSSENVKVLGLHTFPSKCSAS